MQSSNIQFIYHVIEKDGLQFFTIYNVNGAVVYDLRDEDSTPEKCKSAIETFLSMNTGVFKIVFRKTRLPAKGRPSNTWQYTINNMTDSSSKETIGNNVNGNDLPPSDDRFYTIFRELQEENRRLQQDSIASTLNHMQEANRLQMELMQKNFELTSASKDDGMNQMAMTALAGLFGGGGQTGLAGVSGMNDAPVNDVELNKIEIAVKGLMEIDPNFEQNITLLHELAKKNKAIYDMAITQLKNF